MWMSVPPLIYMAAVNFCFQTTCLPSSPGQRRSLPSTTAVLIKPSASPMTLTTWTDRELFAHPPLMLVSHRCVSFVFILSGKNKNRIQFFTVWGGNAYFFNAFYQGIYCWGATGEGTEPPAAVRSHRVLWQTAWLLGHLLTWNWELRADDGRESTFPLGLAAFI